MRVLFLMFCGCLAHSMFAQEGNKVKVPLFNHDQVWDAGIHIGPGFRMLRGNEVIDSLHYSTNAFYGGVYVQYSFPKVISLHAGLAYAQKGSVSNGSIPILDSNGNMINASNWTAYNNFDYLTVPVLCRLNIGKGAKLFINAGPFFSFLMKQTIKTQYSNTFEDNILDNTANMKRFDMGACSGMGIQGVVRKKIALSLELRSSIGFYNVSKLPVVNNGVINTGMASFLLGVGYVGKRRQVGK